MADLILPEIDLYSYQISLKTLEEAHSKIRQSAAILSVLGDWICNSGNLIFGHESNEKLMQVVFLIIELMQDVEKLLPEV